MMRGSGWQRKSSVIQWDRHDSLAATFRTVLPDSSDSARSTVPFLDPSVRKRIRYTLLLHAYNNRMIPIAFASRLSSLRASGVVRDGQGICSLCHHSETTVRPRPTSLWPDQMKYPCCLLPTRLWRLLLPDSSGGGSDRFFARMKFIRTWSAIRGQADSISGQNGEPRAPASRLPDGLRSIIDVE